MRNSSMGDEKFYLYLVIGHMLLLYKFEKQKIYKLKIKSDFSLNSELLSILDAR